MLSNAYFLAKFRFDTAKNEPAKNLQNFAKFANSADPNPQMIEVKDQTARGELLQEKMRAALGAAGERLQAGAEFF